MFFNSGLKQELVFSKDKISNLENKIDKLSEDINLSNQKLAKSQNDNNLLLKEIEELKKELLFFKENKQKNKSPDQSEDKTKKLFKYQNINLKKGLLDIQSNISESTELARTNLSESHKINSTY